MNGVVLWIVGRPSSGKSTFAKAAFKLLQEQGVCACVLDGDAVRAALRPAPGYDPEARDAFYETLANLAALVAAQGQIVLVPATASRAEYRRRAKQLAPDFFEVFVDVPQQEVEARDAKGLYRAVREGRVQGVPGADAPFDAPEHADAVARGGHDTATVEEVVRRVRQRVKG